MHFAGSNLSKICNCVVLANKAFILRFLWVMVQPIILANDKYNGLWMNFSHLTFNFYGLRHGNELRSSQFNRFGPLYYGKNVS